MKKTHSFALRFAFLALVTLGLSGCGTFLTVEGVSTIMSDKTATDHLISWASNKDCSYIRTERGLTYCVEDEVLIKPNVYCYKTIGKVTCYNQPDPRRSPDELMGQYEHNMGQ